ncbi:MAG: hypothetical protein OXI24_17235, partial [Candidatus Poribacteria bacterium]|nr:hypothetical protein [Candidatus Poribacteria bacterium]
IYLSGGTPAVQGPVLTTVQEYDPNSETWTEKADIPTPRTALALGVVAGKIYAVGGTSSVQGPGLTTVEIYDPDTDTWTETSEMPTARVFLGVGTITNKIYAVGGVAEGLGPAILPTVEQFAPSGLSVAALDRFRTVWGKIKKAD